MPGPEADAALRAGGGAGAGGGGAAQCHRYLEAWRAAAGLLRAMRSLGKTHLICWQGGPVTVRGVLQVHSAPPALSPHIEWAVAGVLGMAVTMPWVDQPASPGALRAELNWQGRPGAGGAITSALAGWHRPAASPRTPARGATRFATAARRHSAPFLLSSRPTATCWSPRGDCAPP